MTTLRTLLPLALIAVFATACASSKSFESPSEGSVKAEERTAAGESAKKACLSGDARSCQNYAFILQTEGDRKEAKIYYQKSCDAGDAIGCFSLGLITLEEGKKAEAKPLFQKSCEGGTKSDKSKGHAQACFFLGMLEKELGNPKLAKKWLQKSCTGGVAKGCEALTAKTKKTKKPGKP